MACRMKHLLCFGFGFSARALAKRLDRNAWNISATSRFAEGLGEIATHGINALRFGDALPSGVTHLLVSVPPQETGDPVIRAYGDNLSAAWTGYLSTTGVYGDHQGGWVDEDTPLTPSTVRGKRRVEAERAWLALNARNPLGLHIFRLAGIYGPGRNQLLSVKNGSAQRIVKTNQVFSRIHVDDIASALVCSIARPNPPRAYNVCDDEACPPQDVVAYAAGLLGMAPPPEIPFEQAELSPMARSFYAESKRVANARLKEELGWKPAYPTYREGLKALLASLAL
jgi:nucleoside-diphosphate-sugar epimerase